MNDPHVEALHYRVKHSEDVDYDKAKPLNHDEPGFSVHVDEGRAQITMKSHHATEQAARDEVEPFLRLWELAAALEGKPGRFQFAFERAEVVDRAPGPGHVLHAETGKYVLTTYPPIHRIGLSAYPAPPIRIGYDADVELMFGCFERYHGEGRTLADAAYFCLTILERTAGSRKLAAHRYSIQLRVLNMLGDLTANKGGKEARKVDGAETEYSKTERHWLETGMRVLIRRAAEKARNPSTSLPQITTTDLPKLK